VARSEARIDAQRDLARDPERGELRQHVGRARVDAHAPPREALQRRAVEEIRREHDLLRAKAGREGALDLARADRVDCAAGRAHEREQRQVRARLLGVAHDVEARAQLGDPRTDRRRVVHEERRAVLARQREQELVGEPAGLRCAHRAGRG
jgi:hypothetical protein